MSTPKLAMIPSGYRSSTVYSVLPNNGDGDFTFSRTGTATRVNKDGFIETVSSNVPRLDYSDSSCPSLLLEPQRTNAFTYSQDFSNSDWSKTEFTISSNQVIAPDGTLTASEMFETSASSGKFLHQNTSVATGNDYTVSFFIKYQNKQFIQLTGSTGFDLPYVNFDILNGEIVRNLDNADASIENFGNGWYRISLTLEATSTTNGRILLVGIRAATSLRAESYTGNISDSYYIWGGQMEQGSYPTSYIPTSGSQETRNADTCIEAGNSNVFNDSEGVLYFQIGVKEDNGFISLNDGTTFNRVSVYLNRTNQTIRIICSSGGVSQVDATYTSPTSISENVKVALKYKENDFALWVDGSEVRTDNSALTPIGLSRCDFSVNTILPFYGKCKDLRVYNTALTDEELQQLTTL